MKVIINFNGNDIQIEGTLDEIVSFIRKLLNGEINFPILYVPQIPQYQIYPYTTWISINKTDI